MHAHRCTQPCINLSACCCTVRKECKQDYGTAQTGCYLLTMVACTASLEDDQLCKPLICSLQQLHELLEVQLAPSGLLHRALVIGLLAHCRVRRSHDLQSLLYAQVPGTVSRLIFRGSITGHPWKQQLSRSHSRGSPHVLPSSVACCDHLLYHPFQAIGEQGVVNQARVHFHKDDAGLVFPDDVLQQTLLLNPLRHAKSSDRSAVLRWIPTPQDHDHHA